jgi:hypothetical protein
MESWKDGTMVAGKRFTLQTPAEEMHAFPQYSTVPAFHHSFFRIVEFVKSRQSGRHSKKRQMQGARILRNETYIEVRRSDER